MNRTFLYMFALAFVGAWLGATAILAASNLGEPPEPPLLLLVALWERTAVRPGRRIAPDMRTVATFDLSRFYLWY
jgi:hypothetical protein